MNENFEVEPEVLKAKITAETAQISWLELQKFYAAGDVLQVSAPLDLIEVAFAFATDAKEHVAAWLEQGQLGRVEPDQAKCWFAQQTTLWAVVISPWVLVQDVNNQPH